MLQRIEWRVLTSYFNKRAVSLGELHPCTAPPLVLSFNTPFLKRDPTNVDPDRESVRREIDSESWPTTSRWFNKRTNNATLPRLLIDYHRVTNFESPMNPDLDQRLAVAEC